MNDTEIQKLYELLNDAILKYNKIDYEIVYAYHSSTFNIKMGELEDEECGEIYSELEKWFWTIQHEYNPFYISKGHIYKDGDEFFLNFINLGPYYGEFDEFDLRFTFDSDWFLNQLGMKNDEFIINNPYFDIENVQIYCHLENYRLGDLEHKFDFELKYYLDHWFDSEGLKEEMYDFVLNENQKEIVQQYILKTVFPKYLPRLMEPVKAEQYYSDIDIIACCFFIGFITTSNMIISMNEMYNHYKLVYSDWFYEEEETDSPN